MRLSGLSACALHFLAVIATSGMGFCVRADGDASYEWKACDCCGVEADGCGAGEEGPVVAASPDCGGCSDGVAPLPAGMSVDVPVAVAESEESHAATGSVGLTAESAAAPGVAFAVPKLSSPLRC